MSAELRLGLVGAGSMGFNHARVISGLSGARLEVIVDTDVKRARALSEHFGGTPAGGLEAVAGCDGVIVASSTETHSELALPLIEQGLPLLVEKPMTDAIGETTAIVKAARERGVPLVCGFVERYNAVFTTLLQVLKEPPIHVLTVRHSPVNPRSVSSVALDLLIHDVDLVLTMCAARDVAHVRGATWTAPGESTPDIADCTMQFADGTMATLSASRAGQRKIRTMQVDTGSWLYELDLLRQDITVYRNVNQGVSAGAAYRAETIIDIPFVRHTAEPLALELSRFIRLISEGSADDIEAERNTIVPPHRVVSQLARDVSRRSARP